MVGRVPAEETLLAAAAPEACPERRRASRVHLPDLAASPERWALRYGGSRVGPSRWETRTSERVDTDPRVLAGFRACARGAGALTIGVLALSLSAAPVSGQNPAMGVPPGGAVPGAGLLYMDLGSGEDPTPALELTFTDETPRLWRAGLTAGLISSVEGAVYGYGGLQLPISLPLGLVARPSVSAGLYSAGGGFDLGHALEFRSALVLERRITERVRISTVFFHLSNAGLGRSNPGMEALGFGISLAPSPEG